MQPGSPPFGAPGPASLDLLAILVVPLPIVVFCQSRLSFAALSCIRSGFRAINARTYQIEGVCDAGTAEMPRRDVGLQQLLEPNFPPVCAFPPSALSAAAYVSMDVRKMLPPLNTEQRAGAQPLGLRQLRCGREHRARKDPGSASQKDVSPSDHVDMATINRSLTAVIAKH